MNKLTNIYDINKLVADSEMSLIYVSSESCGVCKVIFPKLMDMLESYPNIKACKADIEELPMLAGEYNVFTIPCLLVFAEGREIIREARYINIEAIAENIERYYSMIFN